MNTVKTLDYGNVVIRKNYTEGRVIDIITIAFGGWAEIKVDWTTGQLFAVIHDDDEN